MLLQDLRYALRTLLQNRAFTAVAVSCLALGIGVNATIFSVVDGVVLNQYPYPQADRIVVLNSSNRQLGYGRAGVSYLDYKDWRDANTTLETTAAFATRSLTLSDGAGDPERFLGCTVSWELFGLIGERPALGRDFRPDDDHPGAEPVVILSDQVWRTRYHSDPSIVGRAVSVNGRSHTIIGVMKPEFAFPQNHRLWVPLAPYGEQTLRNQRGAQVFGRLKPGTTIGQAQSDIGAIAARLESAYPKEDKGWSSVVRPLHEWLLPTDVKLILLTMMGAVTLVLLIACANVANLLLARASVRAREISIRAALGAGRARIVRQLVTESVMIGLVSAPLGIVLAWVGLRLLDLGMPVDSVPYFIRWSLDARAIYYTVGISMATGLVFGLAPAFQAARGNLQDTLKEGGRGSAGTQRPWLRNTLVVVEIALSLVLLVGASLFARSFLNLQNAQLGFDVAPLMTMRYYMPGVQDQTGEAKALRTDDIVKRIEALPGVESAFASNFVPISGGGSDGHAIVEGRHVEEGKEPSVNFVGVSAHLRQTLSLALIHGRDMTEAEGSTKAPVAIINQAMAKRLWPDEDPLGRRFKVDSNDQNDWFTVIGVIADFRHYQPRGDEPPSPSAYVPYAFQPSLNTGLTIRVAGSPSGITAAARAAIRQEDRTLPVFDVRTMKEVQEGSFWQDRLFGMMFAAFGAIALLLASIGVYGVLSYSVSQRTQEIGVRVALGAERRHVMRLVVGQGLKLAAAGVVFGVAGALAITPVIRSQLYNVTPSDPASFSGVALFLSLMAFVASYLPARRATGVDPIIALRNE